MLKLEFNPFPELFTERLRLRKLELNDADVVFIMRTDERVNQFLDRPKPQSGEEVLAFIERIRNNIEKNEAILWVLTSKKENTFIGSICIWNISSEKETAEIGYEMLPVFHGKGFMNEAMKAVVKYGFEKMNLRRIEAFTHENNIASAKLLEKNNFNREDIKDYVDAPEKHVVYVLKKGS